MPQDNKISVVLCVTNCICYDQRILKMASVLEELDTSVLIAGRGHNKCCGKELVKFRTKRFRMLFKKGFLFYKFYNVRLFFFLLFHRFDIIIANDLDTLPAAFLASKFTRSTLVYDSHECFTEVPELTGRKFVRGVWLTIEKVIFPHLKHVITVSDSISDYYFNKYGNRPVVVRNVAPSSEHLLKMNRTDLNIPANNIVLVMQGTGINVDKGAEELVEAVLQLENVNLLIIGSGDIVPELKKKAGSTHKILFIPKVNWETLMRYTKCADAGMCLEKDTNLNYRFSLPNKLFNYISAGIPVISSGMPEVRRLVEQYKSGIVISEVTSDGIVGAIKVLSENREYLNKLKQNALLASLSVRWENEKEIVTDFYKNILNGIS